MLKAFFNVMKYILITLCLIASLVNAQETQKVIILPQSKIYLNGESNINTFSCELCNGSEKVKLDLCYQPEKLSYMFDQNQYTISVDKFVCDNKQITTDLKKALKIEEHPNMYLQLNRLIGRDITNGSKQAEISITIAGVTNDYCLNYDLKDSEDRDVYQVSLASDFDMRDFGIEPPTALMGIIKVKKDIAIKLHLVLEILEENQ